MALSPVVRAGMAFSCALVLTSCKDYDNWFVTVELAPGSPLAARASELALLRDCARDGELRTSPEHIRQFTFLAEDKHPVRVFLTCVQDIPGLSIHDLRRINTDPANRG